MTTYFDYLPTADVIHECIFPYLDYESRIQFNRALPPIERFGRRLGVQATLAHDYNVQYYRMLSQLNYVDNSRTPMRKRCQVFVTILMSCRPTGRCAILLKHNEDLRQTVINKCLEFIENSGNIMHSVTPYFKKKIQRVAAEVLSEVLEMNTGPAIRRKPIQIL